ncbi:MAG TPA: G8 domain-containing protein [Candidatus Paceibacterota bacterium]|nr:G8 domain-containing protein [Candidatus Paceibacterota bacterium]
MRRKQLRPFLLAMLVPAFSLVSVSAVVEAAQQNGSQAIKATRWSDRATWPGRKVPRAGDKVTIAAGKEVILDVSPPPLNGLTINGKLTFADTTDLELTTEWIIVHGELAIGTEASPYTHKATITLTDNVKDEQIMGMGDRGIMLSGGTLNLHGDRTNTWTKLAKTAEAGSTSIEVLNASQWRAGDEIVLASTDFNPRQAERRTIAAIDGNTITLDKKLDYMHFGKITFDVDERGEVGLLTRNIKIQASDDAAQTFFGGHIMAMVTSKMFVEGVELNRMGQNLTLARYPIHWHLVGDAQGQYIKNSAIHDTFNRCVTVHGTNYVHVENNVTYNIVGHCFFLEDGIEHGNEYIHNLAIQIKCHTSKPCVPTNLAASGETSYTYENRQAARQSGQHSKDVLLPSDNTVAAYWITNPDNTFVDNVAAGSDENGFWMSLPEHPNGAFADTDISKATWPRNMRVRKFKGNVAHSNYDGFMMDRNINADNTFGVTGNMHIAHENPADRSSKIVETVFEDLTAYKNRNGGFWGRGEMRTIRNFKAADNAIGYTQASGLGGGASLADPYTSRVLDSLFVGETENIGNPTTDAEKAYGRSLPKPMLPDFPIRGYEYYDARHDVVNTTFRNFEDNATRKTGALSYLLYTSFAVSSNNAIEKVKFENAKPVYFPPMQGNARWANDNGNSQAYKTAVIRDKDGSLGAGPNAYVLINDGVNDSIAADAQHCEIKPTWNAAVCKGDVGRLAFAAPLRLRGAGPVAGDTAGPNGPAAPRADGPGGLAAPAAGAGPGAAPAAGGPRPPGGFFGGPAQPPVVLSRNGRDYTIVNGGSNVRAGTEIKLTTERPTLTLRLTELDKGSWVIFQLPGFNTADSGTQQTSLKALRKASETSYFKDKNALWVKVVSPDDGEIGLGGGATVQVSRQ